MHPPLHFPSQNVDIGGSVTIIGGIVTPPEHLTPAKMPVLKILSESVFKKQITSMTQALHAELALQAAQHALASLV